MHKIYWILNMPGRITKGFLFNPYISFFFPQNRLLLLLHFFCKNYGDLQKLNTLIMVTYIIYCSWAQTQAEERWKKGVELGIGDTGCGLLAILCSSSALSSQHFSQHDVSVVEDNTISLFPLPLLSRSQPKVLSEPFYRLSLPASCPSSSLCTVTTEPASWICRSSYFLSLKL